MRVAVVGAGAAGLAAAWTLAHAGASVKIFERAAQVGGRARSEDLDGCIVDTGAQLFGSGFSTLFRLAKSIGAQHLLVRSPGRDAVFRNGRVHPITYGSVSSMVKSHALPATLKLKLGARYVPFLLRHGRHLDASDPVAAGGDALDNGSVTDWGRRELGNDFLELLAYPLLGAYYGVAPENMSVAVYHALAKAGLDVSVYAVRDGAGAFMQALAEAAVAKGAELQLETEVARIDADDSVVRVQYGDRAEAFDAVVVALPAPHVTRLLELPNEIVQWLNGVRFVPSAVLALVLDQPIQADFFGLSLLRDHRELSALVAICVAANKEPGLVPSDKGLLVCLGSPMENAALVENGEASVQKMVATVDQVFPGTSSHIERAKLYRHLEGYPAFYPGYLKHLRRYPAASLPRGVQLAGDYLVSPTVEGAFRSGERAAQALLRR